MAKRAKGLRGFVALLPWLAAFGLPLEVRGEDALFWTEGGFAAGRIVAAPLSDLTQTAFVGHGGSGISVLALDAGSDLLFHAGAHEIVRSRLNGLERETIAGGFSFSEGIALDPVARHVYWTTWDGGLWRAGYDGADAVQLLDEGQQLFGLALDPVRGFLYWTARDRGIYRANLDGSGREQIASGDAEPLGIAVDPDTGAVYWADFDSGAIQRFDPQGGGTVELIFEAAGSNPIGIALDPENGHVYWSCWAPFGIHRAALDGSDVEWVAAPPRPPWGLALGPRPEPVPPVVRENPDFTIEAVALTDEPAPGAPDGERFRAFQIPTMNADGEIAFAGGSVDVGPTVSGLWTGPPGDLALALRGDEQIPGLFAGAILDAISGGPYRNAAGHLALGLRLDTSVPDVGFLDRDVLVGPDGAGGLRLLGRRRGEAPGTAPGSLFLLEFHDSRFTMNASGVVAFEARLLQGTGDVDASNDTGIWLAEPGAPVELFVRGGDPAPGVPGARFSRVGVPVLNDAGDLAFLGAMVVGEGGVTTGDRDGLWVTNEVGELELAARDTNFFAGDPPDEGWFFFQSPELLPDGRVVLRGIRRPAGGSFTEGIWELAPGAEPRLLVGEGDPVPGRSFVFNDFLPRLAVSPDGEVLFQAEVGGSGNGLFRIRRDGSVHVIALQGDHAPGVEAEFPIFGSFEDTGIGGEQLRAAGIDAMGNAWFAARIRRIGGIHEGNDYTLYRADADGQLSLVLRTGEGLEVEPGDVRRVVAIDVYTDARNASPGFEDGSIVFRVEFEGGSSGIFLAAPPSPEAAARALLALFDDEVAAGGILGAGSGPAAAERRLAALRRMLEDAAVALESGRVQRACAMLGAAADRCDGESTPPDFAAGPGVPGLFEEIGELASRLACDGQ